MEARIRWALWTVPLAGIVGLVGVLLRSPFALPIPDVDRWAAVATQPVFTTSQFLILIGYVLPFIGFWGLYALLQDQKNESIAFWGFMLSVWGTALALPTLGITAFAGPLAASSYLAGNANAAQWIVDAVTGDGFAVGITAALSYTVGPALLGIAVWRSGTLPKWAGLLFALHGPCLSFGFGMYPILIVGWVLLIVSGSWIAIRHWRES